MREFAYLRLTMIVAGVLLLTTDGIRADMLDTTGTEPWDACGGCHGLDGAGNKIKFPRISGLDPGYFVRQLHDFRDARRQNDGGQMQKMMTELEDADLARIAEWFASQSPPWPQPTLEVTFDAGRVQALAVKGVDGMDACISCHSSHPVDSAAAGPRIAGQRDFYLAKQLLDYRDGRRDNGRSSAMQKIAKRLTDSEISGLAIYLSQNPELHEKTP